MSNWMGSLPFMYHQMDQFAQAGGATNLLQHMGGAAQMNGMMSNGAYAMHPSFQNNAGANMGQTRYPYMGLTQPHNSPANPYAGGTFNMASQMSRNLPSQRRSTPPHSTPSHSPSANIRQQACNSSPSAGLEPGASQKPSASPADGTSPDSHVDIASKKGMFGWTTIDSVSVPYIIRDGKQYVSVRIVEQKLLSNFPNNYPEEAMKNGPLSSEFVTAHEAKLLNEINVTHCASEYGQELFNPKDLIVTVEDFRTFYGIIKKNFPTAQGGWLQINNTVVPYAARSGEKFVPLSVVRYAAGLLTDVPVKGIEPTAQECIYLNQACKDVGVDFTFNSSTKFVSVKILESIKTESISLKELPKHDPFGHAEYTVEEDKVGDGVSSTPSVQIADQQATGGISNGQARMPPNVAAAVHSPQLGHSPAGPPPPVYPGGAMNWSGMGVPCSMPGMIPPGMIRMPPIGAGTAGQMHPSINALQNFVASKSPIQTNFVAATRGHSPQQGLLGAHAAMAYARQSGSQQASQTTIRQQPRSVNPQYSNRDVELQKCLARSPPSTMPRPRHAPQNVSSVPAPPNAQQAQLTAQQVQCVDRITSVTVDGKVVSCIDKGGIRYSLLEALGRVYFPDCSPGDFRNVLENVLHLPLEMLQPDEEAAFIHLYRLPVKKLKCNRVIDVTEFERLLPQLRHILEGRDIDDNEGQVDSAAFHHSMSQGSHEPGEVVANLSDNGGVANSDNPFSLVSPRTASGLEQLKRYIAYKRAAEQQGFQKPAKSRRLEDTVNRLKQGGLVDANANTLRDCTRVTSRSESTDSSRSDLLMQSSRSSDAQDRSETPVSAISGKSNSSGTSTLPVFGSGHTSSPTAPMSSLLKEEPRNREVQQSLSDNELFHIATAADGNPLITLDE